MSFITNQLHQRKNMQIYSIFNAILLGSKSNHPEASCDMRYKNDLKGRVYHNLSFKYWIDSSISPFSPRNNYCWSFIFVYSVDQLLHTTTQACGFGMQRWENLGLSLTSFFPGQLHNCRCLRDTSLQLREPETEGIISSNSAFQSQSMPFTSYSFPANNEISPSQLLWWVLFL